MSKIIIYLCALFAPCLVSSAPTSPDLAPQKVVKYLSGPDTIELRSGRSAKHKIVKKIALGSELEIIKTIKEYSLARTKDGTEGWILDQFLTEKPQLKHLITAENKTLKQDLTKLSDQLKKLQDENQQIRHAAEHPLQISDQNAILVKDNVSLEATNGMLSQELQMVRDNSEKQWFLIGIGTILFGMLIGLLLSKLRRRRKSDWGNYKIK